MNTLRLFPTEAGLSRVETDTMTLLPNSPAPAEIGKSLADQIWGAVVRKRRIAEGRAEATSAPPAVRGDIAANSGE